MIALVCSTDHRNQDRHGAAQIEPANMEMRADVHERPSIELDPYSRWALPGRLFPSFGRQLRAPSRSFRNARTRYPCRRAALSRRPCTSLAEPYGIVAKVFTTTLAFATQRWSRRARFVLPTALFDSGQQPAYPGLPDTTAHQFADLWRCKALHDEPHAARRSSPAPSRKIDRTIARMTGGHTALPNSLMRSRRDPYGNLYPRVNPIARSSSGGCSIRSIGVLLSQVTKPNRSIVVRVRRGTSTDCQPPLPSEP